MLAYQSTDMWSTKTCIRLTNFLKVLSLTALLVINSGKCATTRRQLEPAIQGLVAQAGAAHVAADAAITHALNSVGAFASHQQAIAEVSALKSAIQMADQPIIQPNISPEISPGTQSASYTVSAQFVQNAANNAISRRQLGTSVGNRKREYEISPTVDLHVQPYGVGGSGMSSPMFNANEQAKYTGDEFNEDDQFGYDLDNYDVENGEDDGGYGSAYANLDENPVEIYDELTKLLSFPYDEYYDEGQYDYDNDDDDYAYDDHDYGDDSLRDLEYDGFHENEDYYQSNDDYYEDGYRYHD